MIYVCAKFEVHFKISNIDYLIYESVVFIFIWEYSSVGRALALQASGPRFDSGYFQLFEFMQHRGTVPSSGS